MQWYLIICGILALIYITWNITCNIKDWKNLAIGLSIFILFAFSSMRADSVGADTRHYIALLTQLRQMTFSEMLEGKIYAASYGYFTYWELGFRIILFLFVKVFFFLPVRAGLGFISFLTVFFIYKAVKNQSPHPFLSIWLYVTLAFYQTSLNMAQNALSIAMVLWAIQFIKENRPIEWIITVLFATGIHFSAVFFLPMYWIANHTFTIRQYRLLIIIIIVTAIFADRIISSIETIIPNSYKNYLHYNESTSMQFLVLVLHFTLIFPNLLFSEEGLDLHRIKMKYDNLFIKPYFLFFIIEILLYALSLASSGLLRAATLFSPVLVLYIPNLIANLPNHQAKKHMQIYVVFTALTGFVFRMMVNNIGKTMPYLFYWKR